MEQKTDEELFIISSLVILCLISHPPSSVNAGEFFSAGEMESFLPWTNYYSIYKYAF
jgi:hypothetical protein